MDFEYRIEDGCAIITKYKGKDKKVIVPSEINGYSVRSLVRNCFYESGLKRIILPKSLKKLGNCCFIRSGIEEIEIPDSVEEIGLCCFCDCKSLKRVKLPKSLKKLGRGFFYGCRNLTKIEEADILGRFDLYNAFYYVSFNNKVGFPRV